MELLDVLDENGNIIGTEDRKTIHEKVLWHIHVGIWLMNEKGELLFQQRANTKVHPGKWTRTGGHVDSGETPLIGIQREIEEEIGVKIPKEKIELIDIHKAEQKKDGNIVSKNYIYNYFAYVNYKIEDYTMQKEEVSDLKYISIEEMEQIKKENNKNYSFVDWEEYDSLIKTVKEKRCNLSNILKSQI